MLLGRLRIRAKLTLLVAMPLVSMVGLAVPVVLDRIDVARRASDTADAVRVAGRVGTVVRELQQERILSLGYLLNMAERSELVRQSATVTDRIADLRQDLGSEATPEVSASLAEAQKLAELRTAVLARRATPDQVLDSFGRVDFALIGSLRLIRDSDATSPEGRQMVALDAVLHTDEGISAGAATVVLLAATRSPAAATRYVSDRTRMDADMARFRAFATPVQSQLYEMVEQAVAARTDQTFVADVARDPTGATADQAPRDLFPAAASLIRLGQFVERKIVTDVIGEVTERRQQAITEAYTVGLLVLLVLAVVVLLSLTIARTVTRPLTRLTQCADRVARVAEAELVRIADDETESPPMIRLDPVNVQSRDELGDLARAFDRVQGTAARLMERQVASRRNVAQMFGHVGRRTQNLVGRQISLIDQLEQQETDSNRLRHLYRLDHVSSRLRRTAGSLVVLSGAAGGNGHIAPLPLGDVVRLALGEIEDYTRVDVRVPAELAVAPAVIGDLVLTLAELMENATAFSPPHTRVTVAAESLPGGARITLVDHGIGMLAERMTDENVRLTRRERLDLAPTEVLGLFVVGRLARRHGWRVVLSPTSGGGVTVHLDLDDRLLVPRRPEPPVITPASVLRPAPPPAGSPAAQGVRTTPGTAPAAAGPALAPATSESAPTSAPSPAAAEPEPAPDVPAPEPAAAGTVAEPDRDLKPDHSLKPVFDTALLSRATRSLETGQPWNAFEPHPAGTTGSVVGPPRTGNAVLRQRVPGAQLPVRSRTGPTTEPTPADPLVVRALIEEFEAGVRRAQRQQAASREAAAGSTTMPRTGATALSGAGSTAPDGTGAPVRSGPPPGTGQPRLNRRVPGANLTVPPAMNRPNRPSQDDRSTDPEQARELITQFESGVARAMSEVSPDHRREEGTPR